MKILWVKPGKLLPLDTGGKLRTYNLLRHLAASHEVTYVSYYGGRHDPGYEEEIGRRLPGTVTIHTAAPDATTLARSLDYLYRLPWRAPYAVSKFTARSVGRLLGRWDVERRFEVAVCDFLSSTLNFPRRLCTPTALFQHNVETVLWRRKAEREARWFDRLVARIEYAKMRRFEPREVRRFHHVIAVSERDRAAMAPMTDPSRISVVPTGVDLARYRYDRDARPARPLVVFTGSMDWEANIDGVEYFCQAVWPRVRARVPQARFRIVGRDPHPRVRRLAGHSVEVTGTVPSITDHLRQAAVVVVPLRIGGGTRIKIYEAMAMGKATVSTTVGAEGLDVEHGRDILLADDPEELADAVVLLLREEGVRRRYEAAAAATAARYDWSVVTRRLESVLERTIEAAAGLSRPSRADAVRA